MVAILKQPIARPRSRCISRAPPLFAMVKVVSKVSKTLARRNVLIAPGGKGALRKHLRGTSRPADTIAQLMNEPARTSPKALKWVKVSAPAYISGSLHLYPSPAYGRLCIPSHVSRTTDGVCVYANVSDRQ